MYQVPCTALQGLNSQTTNHSCKAHFEYTAEGHDGVYLEQYFRCLALNHIVFRTTHIALKDEDLTL